MLFSFVFRISYFVFCVELLRSVRDLHSHTARTVRGDAPGFYGVLPYQVEAGFRWLANR
jgi:hypothetical protein